MNPEQVRGPESKESDEAVGNVSKSGFEGASTKTMPRPNLDPIQVIDT